MKVKNLVLIKKKLTIFINECFNLGLNVVGLMCLPPIDKPDAKKFFNK